MVESFLNKEMGYIESIFYFSVFWEGLNVDEPK